MKACPLCAEQIQDAAIKCRFCGERLGEGGVMSPLPTEEEMVAQGFRVGNFKVAALLGTGGMGSVFVGEHPDIGKRVALKIMRSDLTANKEAISRFLNEAKTVVKLRHPSIVDVMDYGILDSGQRYLVMEHLEGEDLKSYRRARGRLSPHEAAGIVWQILDALAAAHAAGVIHRDLKPENIFIIPWGRRSLVKLLDFGIAKLLGEAVPDGHHNTQTGVILGTPAYMAPEQAAGRRDLDGRTDLYAVGIILYELVVGRRPFHSPNPGELLLMQQSSPPPPPKLYVPQIPPLLEALILCCLEKDPERRPQTAAELRDELQGLFPTLPRQPLPSIDDNGPGEGGFSITLLDAIQQEEAAAKEGVSSVSTRTPLPTKPKESLSDQSALLQKPSSGPKLVAVGSLAYGHKNASKNEPDGKNGGSGLLHLRPGDDIPANTPTLSQTQGERFLLPPTEPPKERRRWFAFAFAGLGALLLAVAFWPSAPKNNTTGSGSPENNEPGWVPIFIKTSPPAEIFVPDQTPSIGKTPGDVFVPPQGRTIIIRAPGFEERTLRLNRETPSTIEVVLTPKKIPPTPP